MPIEIRHKKVSTALDSDRADQVQPSNWNDSHHVAMTGALAALDQVAPSANVFPVFTSPTSAEAQPVTAFLRTLMTVADSAAFRAAIGAAATADLSGLAPIDSPALTGTPTAPTAAVADSSARLATTAFVHAALADLVGAAPAALDTLAELSAALGDDPDFAATILGALGDKLDLSAVSAFMLSLLGAADAAAARSALALGTAALLNAGTAAGNLVQLDAGGKLPGVDGSQLINLPPAGGIPVGTTIWVNGTAAPAGFLKENGALVSRGDFSALWAYAQASGRVVSEAAWAAGDWGAFSSGDGSTTFRIPDSRGEFVRGLDDGRGVDSGRLLGARQADELRSHDHTASSSVSYSNGVPVKNDTWGTYGYIFGGDRYMDPTNVSVSTTIGNTGGAETRPRNVSKLACIKY
jgi:hypothetical protein